MFIGLTGGIGSGKSTALRLLGELGCATLSTDQVVHEIQSEPETLRAISERFSDSVITPDGQLDRGAVAGIVFSNPEERAWLEGLIWPKVGERVATWRESAVAADPAVRAGVIEVPLLFESGMDQAFDETLAIVADEEVRAQRAAQRGHVGVDERAARQHSQDEKSARATWTVANNGSEDDLRAQLSRLLATIGV
jgi:dephospho-CoA kinase